jgi:hypothetical protein
VRERAARGPSQFIRGRERDRARAAADRRGGGWAVETLIGDPEPLAAIQDAVNIHGFDEIILSTLSARVSRWLRLDLPHKLNGLGLPVTTSTARGREEAAVPSS